MKKHIMPFAVLLLLSTGLGLAAAEYFVSPDDNSFDVAKAKLQAGDTVTFMPGEYRNYLETHLDNITLKAAIPGSVALRGDIDAPQFAHYRNGVWKCSLEKIPEAVNERDTLKIYDYVTTVSELECSLGAWTYDAAKKELYVRTFDEEAPDRHYLTISVISHSGIAFQTEKDNRGIHNVHIDGLAVTGFNNRSHAERFSRQYVNWGIYICSPRGSSVSRVDSFLNASSIGFCGIMNYGYFSENSVIEDCRTYGNYSPFFISGGGIMIFKKAINCAIRRNFEFDNRPYNASFYGGDGGELDNCVYEDNISANGAGRTKLSDSRKTEVRGCIVSAFAPYFTPVKNTVVTGYIENYRNYLANNILLYKETDISADASFADPVNFDYRPQFAASEKVKRNAPKPFSPSVYFVKSGCKDDADGNSSSMAFGTLQKANEKLTDGAELYLMDTLAGDLILKNKKKIAIRGRGAFPVVIKGQLIIENCEDIRLERVAPARITVKGGENISVSQSACDLQAENVQNLRVTHSLIPNSSFASCQDAFITANVFSNKTTAAVVGWSDYNAYPDSNLIPANEKHSFAAVPETGKGFAFKNAYRFNGRALNGMPVGPCRRQPAVTLMKMEEPKVFALSSESANIQFTSNISALGSFFYGDTPECKNQIKFAEAPFQNVGLTNLIPGGKYYFKVNLSGTLSDVYSNQLLDTNSGKCSVASPIKEFTTPVSDIPAKTYHVAVTGNDKNLGSAEMPWRTISYSAVNAKPGDTVVIHGGNYIEQIRFRVSGSAKNPITFTGAKGENVTVFGDQNSLMTAFTLKNQHFINLDNFTVKNFQSSAFLIEDCSNICLSRILIDQSGGQTYGITAWRTPNLTLTNCVRTLGHGGLQIYQCPNFLMDHCVMVLGGVCSMTFENENKESVTIRNSIITGNILMKTYVPSYFVTDANCLTEDNNCYFARLPESEHPLICYYKIDGQNVKVPGVENGSIYVTYPDFLKNLNRKSSSVFANPQMKAFPKFLLNYSTLAEWRKIYKSHTVDDIGWSEPSALQNMAIRDFFAANPEVIKRSIGLKPEAFKQ